MTPELSGLIREILLRHPKPPRQMAYSRVLDQVFKSKSMKTVSIVTLSLAALLFVLAAIGRSQDRNVSIVFGVVSLVFATVPLVYAFRLSEAIRSGRAEVAIVEHVEYSAPGSQATLDAIENGIATGKWRLSEGTLLEFEVDEPWSKDLRVGSSVELLVTKPTRRGVFALHHCV